MPVKSVPQRAKLEVNPKEQESQRGKMASIQPAPRQRRASPSPRKRRPPGAAVQHNSRLSPSPRRVANSRRVSSRSSPSDRSRDRGSSLVLREKDRHWRSGARSSSAIPADKRFTGGRRKGRTAAQSGAHKEPLSREEVAKRYQLRAANRHKLHRDNQQECRLKALEQDKLRCAAGHRMPSFVLGRMAKRQVKGAYIGPQVRRG